MSHLLATRGGAMDYRYVAIMLRNLAQLCEKEQGPPAEAPLRPLDPERARCKQVLEAIRSFPEEGLRLVEDARAEAKDEGREEGIGAMRYAQEAAHERYMGQLADLQSKHDALRVELQQLQRSEPPQSLLKPIRRPKWIGCVNPAHVHTGDPHCPECLWE